MQRVALVRVLIVSALILLAYYMGGMQLVVGGLKNSGSTLLKIAPLLILAFGITGMIQGLLSEDLVRRWLGREAGFKGVLLGGLAGACLPGGPYVFYPIAVAFLKGGAEIGTIIAFIAAHNLWSITRIPLEIALIGWPVFIARYSVTLAFPIIMGLLANLFYPRAADSIREWITANEHKTKGGMRQGDIRQGGMMQ